MYVCMYACVYTYTLTAIYIYICMHIRKHMHVCMYMCWSRHSCKLHIYLHRYTDTISVCVCVCVCVFYVYVYMYVCTRSYAGRAFVQIWSPPPSKSTMVWCHSGVADRESNVSIKCEHPTIMVLVIEGVNTPVDGGVLQRLSSDVSWPARRRVHVSLRLSKKLLRKSGGCHTKRVPA